MSVVEETKPAWVPHPSNPVATPGAQYESLHAAKLAVMAKCPYLQKDTAKGLGYSFASESGLVEKLHPAMTDAGLTWGPVGVQMLESSDYQTKNGVVMFRVRVLVVYRLTHAATGQFEEYHAIGEASDMGDKGCAKAMTMAQKYALRQAFLIETGDDPDREPSEESQPGSFKSNPVDTRPPYDPKAPTKPRNPAPDAPPAQPNPSPEQREAAAVEAIKMASDENRLNVLELNVIERTGSVFTPAQVSRLLALISEQRKKFAAPKGSTPLGQIPAQGFGA